MAALVSCPVGSPLLRCSPGLSFVALVDGLARKEVHDAQTLCRINGCASRLFDDACSDSPHHGAHIG